MTPPKMRNIAVVALLALILSACGDANLSTPTQPLPTSTATAVPPTAAPTKAPAEAPSITPIAAVSTNPTAAALAVPTTLTTVASSFPEQMIPGVTTQPADQSTASVLSPPNWVKAGVRLTYYNAAASIAQSNFAWVEDPDGPWYDATTGKHYRRTDESGENMGDGGGDGYSQYDIIAVEGTDVVISSSILSIDRVDNAYVPAPGAGVKTAGATVDGLWIHPTQLAQIAQTGETGLLVLEGDYPLNGVTYKAITFGSTDPNAYQSYVYDTKTGLLLSATTSTQGATTVGGIPGNKQITITRFAGLRQRTMPGFTGANPSWVATRAKMAYTGLYNFTNPMATDESYTFNASSTAILSKGGRNWANYSTTTAIQGLGSPATAKGVTGTTGTYWMDVASLKAMKANQKLDSDPITNELITVKSITTQGTRKIVTISDQLAGIDILFNYDQASGALVSYQEKIATSGATYQFQLQQAP